MPLISLKVSGHSPGSRERIGNANRCFPVPERNARARRTERDGQRGRDRSVRSRVPATALDAVGIVEVAVERVHYCGSRTRGLQRPLGRNTGVGSRSTGVYSDKQRSSDSTPPRRLRYRTVAGGRRFGSPTERLGERRACCVGERFRPAETLLCVRCDVHDVVRKLSVLVRESERNDDDR